ncbi:myelin-associated glycoprotein-like isoform X2 [Plectropomus leopardus]|uniref:myelin-associated glycoprotein-like isoform X2 n=1 Tax=Plectropomus leopardus TaxID=160734 RepID=UPI001C4AA4A3|nr:myelin-associated glycoprotein-like isoform X2 [Plectropomus leopardus]XP_042346490.1 myelin-associated glycoprotein-like isoform X2 [Plectropomus leopardus]
MELRRWVPFLLLHVIHDVQSSSSQWIANVPTKIPVLHGSCVVIPCIYNYPKPISKQPLNRRTGYWMKGRKVVSTTIPKWKLPMEYKKRTQFLGDLQARNCTMLLDGVRTTDVGPFYFRIEMPQYKSFSYKRNAVSIDVIREPQPPSLSVKVNDQVTASCSVSHACPVIPPQLSWSRSGIITRRSKRLNVWMWETMSTLTFPFRPADVNKPLNCTVQYRGRKQAMSSTILKI